MASARSRVSAVIHSSSAMLCRYASIRFATSSSIAAFDAGGKCRSTYTRPIASPIAASDRPTPRFQRSRLTGTPVSCVP